MVPGWRFNHCVLQPPSRRVVIVGRVKHHHRISAPSHTALSECNATAFHPSGDADYCASNACHPSSDRCHPPNNTCPSPSNTCPSPNNTCPSPSNTCPPSGNTCPPSGNTCPPFSNACPPFSNACHRSSQGLDHHPIISAVRFTDTLVHHFTSEALFSSRCGDIPLMARLWNVHRELNHSHRGI